MKLNSEQKEFIEALKAKGFRVYLANPTHGRNSFYGFFTKDDEPKLISFQLDFLLSVSGNYVTDNPKLCGTGWRIASDLSYSDIVANANSYYNSSAPSWATMGSNWRYATVKEHLNQYQRSSNFTLC